MAQATPSLMISGHREGAQQPAGRIAASLTIIVIIGIGNQGYSGPDAAGFNCTVDCSGHEAGYRWAEQHSIDDEDYCPDGDSESFHEGCIAYVRGEPQAAPMTTIFMVAIFQLRGSPARVAPHTIVL
jgi:hypothetical protein